MEGDLQQPSKGKPGGGLRYVWQALFVSLTLSVGVLVLVLRENTLDLAALSRLVRWSPLGIGALVLCLLGWWLFAGWRLQLLAADMGGRVTLARATRAYILGLFSASVTPAATGQSLAIGWYLSRYINARQAAGIAVYTIALDLVFYAWSLPVSFLVLRAGGVNLPIPGGVFTVGFASVLALALAWALANRAGVLSRLVWTIFSVGLLRRWRRGATVSVWRVSRVLSQFAGLPWTAQVGLHATTFGLYLMHFGVLNAVALALGLEVHHLNVLAVQTLVVALSFLIPTPGGSGYFEAALAVALTGQVPDEARALLIVMWRLSSYWIYFLIGPMIGGLAFVRGNQVVKSDAV